jgi:uncharacterized protein YlxP (DUF503 family)
MLLAVLQFDLFIRDAQSLKDKRRVVSSLKDRLHREHLVSIAEVALQDRAEVARLALALVTTDARHASRVLDQITAKLRALPDAQLGDVSRRVSHADLDDASEPADPATELRHDDALREEMLRRGGEGHDPFPGAHRE